MSTSLTDEHSQKRRQSVVNLIVGWTVYPAGDLIAQLLGGHVNPLRILVMAVVGGLIYRYEVPLWFGLLDRYELSQVTLEKYRFLRVLVRDPRADGHLNWVGRTLGAILYFNPLWIARHMLFIRLGDDPASLLQFASALRSAVLLGAKSFLLNLPISLAGNYVIQMRVPLRWRFLGSSIFSGALATAYALAYRIF